MKLIQVQVKEVVQDPGSEAYFRLILEDVDKEWELSIMISTLDARALQLELDGRRNTRPQTHDIFVDFIEVAGYQIVKANIQDFRRGIYYASLVFSHPESGVFEMDCRPSDAVTLSLRTGAPIYIDIDIMKKVGKPLGDRRKGEDRAQRLLAMEAKLQCLVREERYEEAGVLRDKIRNLKAEIPE